MKIGIIGAGRWGTALSYICSFKVEKVYLWTHRKEIVAGIKKTRRNPFYLPFLKLHPRIEPTNSLSKVFDGDIIIIAIPVQGIRETLLKLPKKIKKEHIFISASKGLELNTMKRPSEIISEISKNQNIFVLSGPNFAEEIAKELPSATSLAGEKGEAEKIQKILSTPFFRVYISEDIKGVELGGALKNVYAIGAGIIDGLGLGHNARASYITRSIVEIARFGTSFGANPKTFGGLSGIGDLILTSTGDLSRNRTFGIRISKKEKIEKVLKELKTVEGYWTVRSLIPLAKKLKIDMPIAEKIYEILYQNKSPDSALTELMARPLKREDIF